MSQAMKRLQSKFKNITITEFWNVTPCSLTVRYQSFEETCCFHLQDIRVCEYFKVGRCDTVLTIFPAKKKETREWRKMYNEEQHHLH
jgi:hypothetical protein